MSDVRNSITVYFDNEEQKTAFRLEAAKAGMSMAELARSTLCNVFFLPDPSIEIDDCAPTTTKLAA